jgi:hypothetical protein
MENIFLLHGSYEVVLGTAAHGTAKENAAQESLDKEARPFIFFTMDPTVRGRPVNAPSRRPQLRSIRTMSLPDTTCATTHNFARPVHSVSDR